MVAHVTRALGVVEVAVVVEMEAVIAKRIVEVAIEV